MKLKLIILTVLAIGLWSYCVIYLANKSYKAIKKEFKKNDTIYYKQTP